MAFQLSDDGQALIKWPNTRWAVRPSAYGWDFTDANDGNEYTAENQITIRLVSQQGGKSSWGIMLTAVDGLVHFEGGLSNWDLTGNAIEQALLTLLVIARWKPEFINEWRHNA